MLGDPSPITPCSSPSSADTSSLFGFHDDFIPGLRGPWPLPHRAAFCLSSLSLTPRGLPSLNAASDVEKASVQSSLPPIFHTSPSLGSHLTHVSSPHPTPNPLESKHCVCVLSCFSYIQFSMTPWTVACQAPLSMGILQARMLGWVAKPSSRGSSRHRDRTCIACGSCGADGFFTTESPRKPRVSNASIQMNLECSQVILW